MNPNPIPRKPSPQLKWVEQHGKPTPSINYGFEETGPDLYEQFNETPEERRQRQLTATQNALPGTAAEKLHRLLKETN